MFTALSSLNKMILFSDITIIIIFIVIIIIVILLLSSIFVYTNC